MAESCKAASDCSLGKSQRCDVIISTPRQRRLQARDARKPSNRAFGSSFTRSRIGNPGVPALSRSRKHGRSGSKRNLDSSPPECPLRADTGPTRAAREGSVSAQTRNSNRDSAIGSHVLLLPGVGTPRRHCPHPPSADGLRTAPSLTARMPPGVPRASPFHSLESPGSAPAAFACAIALATVANVGAPSCIDSTAVDGTMTIVALLRLRPSYSMFIARR